MSNPTKTMNHAEYQKNLKGKTVPELMFIMNDASAAIKANPDNPNNGYYADEINYAGMELKKRRDGK
jgi:hypothetical protein